MVSARNDPNATRYKDNYGRDVVVGDTKAAEEGAKRNRSRGSNNSYTPPTSAKNDPNASTYVDNSGNPVYVGSTDAVQKAVKAKGGSGSGSLPSDNPALKQAIDAGKQAGIDNARLSNLGATEGTYGVQKETFIQQAKKAGYSDSAINRSLATGQPLLPSDSKVVDKFVRTQIEAGYSPDAVQRAVMQGTPLLPSDNLKVQAQVRGLQSIGTNEEAAAFGALPISQSVVSQEVVPPEPDKFGPKSKIINVAQKPSLRDKYEVAKQSIIYGFKNPSQTTLSEKDVTNLPAASAFVGQLGKYIAAPAIGTIALTVAPAVLTTPLLDVGITTVLVKQGTEAAYSGGKKIGEGIQGTPGKIKEGLYEAGIGAGVALSPVGGAIASAPLRAIVGKGAAQTVGSTLDGGAAALLGGVGYKQAESGFKQIFQEIKDDGNNLGILPGIVNVGMGATNVALGVFGVKAAAAQGIASAERALVPRVVSKGKPIEVIQTREIEYSPALIKSRTVDGVADTSSAVMSRSRETSKVITPYEVKAEIASGRGDVVLEVRNIEKVSQGKTAFKGKLQTGETKVPFRPLADVDAPISSNEPLPMERIADEPVQSTPIADEIVVGDTTIGDVVAGGSGSSEKTPIIDLVPAPTTDSAVSAPILDSVAAPTSSASTTSATPLRLTASPSLSRNEIVSAAGTQAYIKPTGRVEVIRAPQVNVLQSQDVTRTQINQLGEPEIFAGDFFAMNRGKQVTGRTAQRGDTIIEPQALSDDQRALKTLFSKPVPAKTYKPTDGLDISAELADTFTFKGTVRTKVGKADIESAFTPSDKPILIPDTEAQAIYGTTPAKAERDIARPQKPGKTSASRDIVSATGGSTSRVDAVPIVPEVLRPLGTATTKTQGTINILDESSAIGESFSIQESNVRGAKKVSGSRSTSRIVTQANPKRSELFGADTPSTFAQQPDYIAGDEGIFSGKALAKRGPAVERDDYLGVSDLTEGENVGLFKEPVQKFSVNRYDEQTYTQIESTTTPLFGSSSASSERVVFEEVGDVSKSITLEPRGDASGVRKEKGALKFVDSPQNAAASSNEFLALTGPTAKPKSASIKLKDIITPQKGTTDRTAKEILRDSAKQKAREADEKSAKDALDSLFNGGGQQQTVFAETEKVSQGVSTEASMRFARTSTPRVDATSFVQDSIPILPTTFQSSNRLNGRVVVLPPSAGSAVERRISSGFRPTFDTRFVPVSRPDIVRGLAPTSILGPSSAQRPRVDQDAGQKPATIPDTIQRSGSNTLQKPAMQQAQAQALKTDTLLKQTIFRPIRVPRIPTSRPPIPPPIPKEPELPSGDDKKRKKRRGLFDVFVRRRGKFEKATRRPLTEDQARNFGAFEVKRSAAATFETRPSSSDDAGAFNIKESLKDFYKQGVNRFIQKANTRITSSEEKREITYKGIQARRGSSIFSRKR